MTLDILDNIKKVYEKNVSYPDDIRLKFYTSEFLLDEKNWNDKLEFLKNISFEWKEIKYSELAENKIENNKIPKEKGIYKFIVRPNVLINNLPKFVLYIGITNESLNKRIKNYTQIKLIKKREKIDTLIHKYYNNLYISFTPINNIDVDLKLIETNLIGFYGTHILANTADAPINLKKQQKAF